MRRVSKHYGILMEHHHLPRGPLLAPVVLQGVVVLVLPHLDEEQSGRHPAVVSHDDGVHEEANSCLGDNNYTIGEEAEPVVDQPVVHVPEDPLHDIQLSILVGEIDCWQHVSPQPQVDKEDGHGGEGQRDARNSTPNKLLISFSEMFRGCFINLDIFFKFWKQNKFSVQMSALISRVVTKMFNIALPKRFAILRFRDL